MLFPRQNIYKLKEKLKGMSKLAICVFCQELGIDVSLDTSAKKFCI